MPIHPALQRRWRRERDGNHRPGHQHRTGDSEHEERDEHAPHERRAGTRRQQAVIEILKPLGT